MQNEIREECGVFGIFDPDEKLDIAHLTYIALYSLQHRGQQSSGIAINDGGSFKHHRDNGLTGDVFSEAVLRDMKGHSGIGHVRSAAAGFESCDNAQPMLGYHVRGRMALAFNGALANGISLRRRLVEGDVMFTTLSDAEIIGQIIVHERIRSDSTDTAVVKAMKTLSGAYSMVVLCAHKLIAARDPMGIRPLCMGHLGNATIFASESCAIRAIGGTFDRDIRPGEVVTVSKERISYRTENCGGKTSLCIFEHIYTARPDSIIDGQSVHLARKAAGAALAKRHPVDADVVVGVPDSGLDAALGYAEESGIPYGMGLMKNRYIGRTFIHPGQSQRENLVQIKLQPMTAVIEGKRVVIVDDSIVRGTTTKHLIKMLRDFGAKEVHLRISSPPFINPCYYGTDIASRDKLIACRMTTEEIRADLDADSLGYLAVEDLKSIAPDSGVGFCDACFTGNYPIQPEGEPYEHIDLRDDYDYTYE